MRDFGLGGFTTGCGCVSPKLSVALRQAAARGDWAEAERLRALFEPLEDLRNAISPICVLHEAVAAAGIADTGPLLPLLDRVPAGHRAAIQTAASALAAVEC
jgi:dihydrodipicolinate synthase/N-acetylneuraminate lyase